MENSNSNIVELIIGLVAGGGISGLITAVVMSRKTKQDITTSNIDMALRLRDEAVKEYNSIDEKLQMARTLLEEAQGQLSEAKRYIDVLCDILDEHNIEYPQRPNIIYGIMEEEKKGADDGKHNGKTA